MLLTLDLNNFVLVKTLSLKFKAGFTSLTGETGAGKSILLDALGFLLGDKADTQLIRHGDNKTEVSATFLPSNTALSWLIEHGFIHKDEDKTLHLKRVLNDTGKSRCMINGSVATLTQMRQIGMTLLTIHGQGEHHALLKSNYQRDLLDQFAENSKERQEVFKAYKHLQIQLKALKTAQEQHSILESQREQLAWVYETLSAIQPIEGEWEQLDIEHKRLSHSATLLSDLNQISQALEGHDNDEGLVETVRSLHHQTSQLNKLDEAINDITQPLETAYIQLQEAVYNIEAYLNKTDLDPERLYTVEERIAQLHSTSRKLRLTPNELPTRFESVQAELNTLNTHTNLIYLEEAVNKAKEDYKGYATQLSKTRLKASTLLGADISTMMQGLALSGGIFEVKLTQNNTPSSEGLDTVDFYVSTNAGQPLQLLSKVASGGELARISLALCVVTQSQSPVPTLIFDEVDTGIGGATADVVGQCLRQLAHLVQVLAVTHLPQVAANAHQQFKVSKTTQTLHTNNDNVIETTSTVTVLSNTERINEIARMLGGKTITHLTQQHAQELLNTATKTL